MDDQKNKTSEIVHKFAPVSPVINCSFSAETREELREYKISFFVVLFRESVVFYKESVVFYRESVV